MELHSSCTVKVRIARWQMDGTYMSSIQLLHLKLRRKRLHLAGEVSRGADEVVRGEEEGWLLQHGIAFGDFCSHQLVIFYGRKLWLIRTLFVCSVDIFELRSVPVQCCTIAAILGGEQLAIMLDVLSWCKHGILVSERGFLLGLTAMQAGWRLGHCSPRFGLLLLHPCASCRARCHWST